MAIMGRKKRAVAQGWNAINKQRDQESKKIIEQSEKKEEVTREEHEAKIKMLKELGLLKD